MIGLSKLRDAINAKICSFDYVINNLPFKLKSKEHIIWIIENEIGYDCKKMPKKLLAETISMIKNSWHEGTNFLVVLQMFNPAVSVLKKRSVINRYTPYCL